MAPKKHLSIIGVWHLILGTTGFGRGKSLPEMPQMPIQDIDKKLMGLICLSRLSSNAWRRGSSPWPKWWIGVAESTGWDENETGARFAKPKLVPCAICKKWLRTKQKTTFASDQQIVAYFMAYTTGLWACQKKHPNRETETWCVWGRSAHRSPSALHHTAVTTLRFAPVCHMKQNTDMLHVKSIHRDIVILWLKRYMKVDLSRSA